MTAVRLVRSLSRVRWSVALTVWALMFVAGGASRAATSWHYFETGVGVLFDPDGALGGLHLYAVHPELQIGPVSFVVAAPFAAIGSHPGTALAIVLMLGCGVLVLAVVRDLAAAHASAAPSTMRVAELIVTPAWIQLSVGVGHLDDALAMTGAVVGLWAVHRHRPIVAACALALAVDAKPWALGFVALLLVLPRRELLRAAVVWTVLVFAAWTPFVAVDPHTLDAFGYRIANSPSSALRALGVHTAQTPQWCRSVQLFGGLAVAAFVGLRHRPAAVVLVVVALRMLFDPATHIYYDAGLLVATVIFDVLGARARLPWLTMGATAAVFVPGYVVLGLPVAAPVVGGLRAAYLIAAILVALVVGGGRGQASFTRGRAGLSHVEPVALVLPPKTRSTDRSDDLGRRVAPADGERVDRTRPAARGRRPGRADPQRDGP